MADLRWLQMKIKPAKSNGHDKQIVNKGELSKGTDEKLKITLRNWNISFSIMHHASGPPQVPPRAGDRTNTQLSLETLMSLSLHCCPKLQ